MKIELYDNEMQDYYKTYVVVEFFLKSLKPLKKKLLSSM